MQMNYASKQSDQSYPEIHASKKKGTLIFGMSKAKGVITNTRRCDKNYTDNYAVLQQCIVFREQAIGPGNLSERYSSLFKLFHPKWPEECSHSIRQEFTQIKSQTI
jgi:hypothetical protein